MANQTEKFKFKTGLAPLIFAGALFAAICLIAFPSFPALAGTQVDQEVNNCNNNNVCEPWESETSCSADCYSGAPSCDNDGVCETGENYGVCPNDCARPPGSVLLPPQAKRPPREGMPPAPPEEGRPPRKEEIAEGRAPEYAPLPEAPAEKAPAGAAYPKAEVKEKPEKAVEPLPPPLSIKEKISEAIQKTAMEIKQKILAKKFLWEIVLLLALGLLVIFTISKL